MIVTRCALVRILAATAVVLSAPRAQASDVGRYIADRIDAASYRYYLQEVLYAHDGDDRSLTGPEHDLARDAVLATFQEFGLPTELHVYSSELGPGYNVVATQTGTVYPDAQYIVGAHYDSVGNPGADDDASGVAALLEIARVLTRYETEYTVVYIAFDMEEDGLIGSAAYVAEHVNDDIRGMISLDMIAWDYGLYSATIAGRTASDPIKNALAAAIVEYGSGLDVFVGGRRDRSDHAPFEAAGFQACWLSERVFQLNPCYHLMCDSVDTADYLDYDFAANHVRSVAGFLADHARVHVTPCAADLDGDWDTDQADLGVLLASYGIDGGGDLDGDADTDGADLGILLADWGCTP